ncbi:MAG: histidine kinase dimerization/phospho-acceptor domain-containing protein, partial [Bryobacteraceae bacterium]
MTARLYLKLLAAVMGVLAVALATVDVVATRVAESSYVEQLERELGEKGRLIAVTLEGSLDARSAERARTLAHAAGGRLTMIAHDGHVMLDTGANASQMENHRERPEMARALKGARGSAVRQSATTGVKYLYVAVPIAEGALRLAMPLSEVEGQVNALRWRMLGVTLLAFLPAALIAALIARRLSRELGRIIGFAGELARGNFRARLAGSTEGELGLLRRRLNDASEHLQRAVEQLDREHAELERVERVRKDFVINVSHELRTPLASIQGYAETLMDGAIEDRANNMRFLGIIRQNAERLASLTADLLTLSRIELKRQDLHFAECRATHLITEAADTVRPVAEKKRIELSVRAELPDDSVECDSEAVHQILINLLDNAIKYTPEGGSIVAGARP